MSKNTLAKAMKNKQDEFYTSYSDIEAELVHYDFRGKTVYCNCDDPRKSNFFKYFHDNFTKLGLKSVIASHYKKYSIFSTQEPPVFCVYQGDKVNYIQLKGNGSFESAECIALLERADIVVTNPPFSLFRSFIKLLSLYNKHFLIIGNVNAVSYNHCFKLIHQGKMWLGHTKPVTFTIPDNYRSTQCNEQCIKIAKLSDAIWYTNIGSPVYKDLHLTKTYNEKDYPKYDNYNAIEVGKTKNIPIGYTGLMGLPITYIYYHNPSIYRIVGVCGDRNVPGDPIYIKGSSTYIDPQHPKHTGLVLNGKAMYCRLIVQLIQTPKV